MSMRLPITLGVCAVALATGARADRSDARGSYAGPAGAAPLAVRFKAERARAALAVEALRAHAPALRVAWSATRTRPAMIHGLATAVAGKDDVARARAFLARYPALFVDASGAHDRLVLVDQQRAHGVRVVRLQHLHRGIPVADALVTVALDDAGRVTAVGSELEPIALAGVTPAIDAAAALAAVRGMLGVSRAVGSAQLAIVAEGAAARMVYRVVIPYPLDPQGRIHLVDAQTGKYVGARPGAIVEVLR